MTDFAPGMRLANSAACAVGIQRSLAPHSTSAGRVERLQHVSVDFAEIECRHHLADRGARAFSMEEIDVTPQRRRVDRARVAIDVAHRAFDDRFGQPPRRIRP
ncbi:hypothetical protein [Paraburkholderia sp. RAU2J]|uniref:hypothetical protein n=1 Tax=Paraburkholderia sp. RAU2J TaxID=1938810 RepID=UPI0013156311|nr:hypothetical protein [Paraburkholderia sp. RAU2J]